MAGLKYLMYSFCGAYLALFGLFFLNRYCTSLTFTPGGTLNMEAVQGHEGLLLLVVFCMILGFGVKAGMFPMHAWLPTAHPVAPSPASAVLSGIIVKSGVLAIIRVVYELVGVSFVAGTWVQHAWLILSLITVFMGSLLAYREPVLKKRLAYSTVSQLSYILFGLALFNQTAATGALLHVIVHAVIKTALFLCAGALIMQTGKKEVSAFRGIGKTMPVTLWCYTFVSLGLIGIPPFSGLVSKWYLATGALEGGMAVYSWLGPVVLLVSALLTAGYLLPVTIDGFLPGADYEETKKRHEPILMVLPLVILAALTLGFGLFPNPLIRFLSGIVSGWF
jgi:multicomponent Na+:H+ antiporter subunit D